MLADIILSRCHCACHSVWATLTKWRWTCFNRTFITTVRRLRHGLHFFPLWTSAGLDSNETTVSPVSALQASPGVSGLAYSNSQPFVSSLTIRGRWLFDFELCTRPMQITHTATWLVLKDLILLNLLQQQNSLSPSPPAGDWSVAMRRLTFKGVLLGHHPPNPASPYRLASAEPWGEGAREVSDPVRGADTRWRSSRAGG